MKKLSLVFIALMLMQGIANAQIRRGLWEYGPVITTTNNGYGWVAENLKVFGISAVDGFEFANNNRWWIPSFRARFDVLKDIDIPAGDVKVKWADWGLKNYSIGYHLGYMSYVAPIGFDVQVDYEQQTWRAKFPGQESYTNYRKQMIVPTVLLKTRFGDFAKNSLNVFAEAGAKYNCVVGTKGDYDKTKSLNNGFTGVIGIGLINTITHFTGEVRYEHDFFNYFNEDFSPDGITKPYKDVTSKHSAITVYLAFGF